MLEVGTAACSGDQVESGRLGGLHLDDRGLDWD